MAAATIYGTVKDSSTGTNITNATVSCPGYTVTNANGNYTFKTLGAATVIVTAAAPNYVTQNKEVSVSSGQIKQVNFSLVHV